MGNWEAQVELEKGEHGCLFFVFQNDNQWIPLTDQNLVKKFSF